MTNQGWHKTSEDIKCSHKNQLTQNCNITEVLCLSCISFKKNTFLVRQISFFLMEFISILRHFRIALSLKTIMMSYFPEMCHYFPYSAKGCKLKRTTLQYIHQNPITPFVWLKCEVSSFVNFSSFVLLPRQLSTIPAVGFTRLFHIQRFDNAHQVPHRAFCAEQFPLTYVLVIRSWQIRV